MALFFRLILLTMAVDNRLYYITTFYNYIPSTVMQLMEEQKEEKKKTMTSLKTSYNYVYSDGFVTGGKKCKKSLTMLKPK